MKRGPGKTVTGKKSQATSHKRQAPSAKRAYHQATSSNNSEISVQLREGHGPWPLDNSSWIEDPGISFTEHGPRVRAKINVCLGWATCLPSKLRFSIRFQTMEGVFFLRSWYNFRSDVSAFFKVTNVYLKAVLNLSGMATIFSS